MTGAKTSAELRAHVRFLINDERIARVRLANGQSYPLRDLSYSGFSVAAGFERLSMTSLRIEIFTTGVDAHASLVHSADGISGFSFQHKTVETLIFLQPFLERMRIGSTLELVPENASQGKLREEGAIIFRGDGPTECHLTMGPDGVKAFTLGFFEGSRYVEAQFKGGQFFSSRQVETTGDAPRMSPVTSADQSILQHACFIMLGCNSDLVKKALKLYLSKSEK